MSCAGGMTQWHSPKELEVTTSRVVHLHLAAVHVEAICKGRAGHLVLAESWDAVEGLWTLRAVDWRWLAVSQVALWSVCGKAVAVSYTWPC